MFSGQALLRVGTTDPDVLAQLAGFTAEEPDVVVGLMGGHPDRGDPINSLDPAFWHLVVAVDHSGCAAPDGPDVVVSDEAAVDWLWHERIAPWVANLRCGRRAPRERRALLVPHRGAWAGAARRLLARLQRAAPEGLLRADHIGSTAVPGLEAKPLLDLQLVLHTLPTSTRVAEWAHATGLISASGEELYAIDRHDVHHPEIVLVDADPGEPVNVHLHQRSSPVWREVLDFRDWLRAHPSARAEYQSFKRSLARPLRSGPSSTTLTHVDDYGRAKRAWVNDAVARAQRWAAGEAAAQ